jgi:hypothetical protein
MRYQVVLAQSEAEQHLSEAQETEQAKLTTGEYRHLLHQQYERLAQHQQVIEAERQAEVTC